MIVRLAPPGVALVPGDTVSVAVETSSAYRLSLVVVAKQHAH